MSNVELKTMLEQLTQTGSPVDLSVADKQDQQRVEILQEEFGSQILELEDGRVGYMAQIALTNLLSRTIDILEVELRTPWDDHLFQWLQPVEVRSKDYSGLIYRLGKCIQFGPKEVINRRLFEQRSLPGKRRIEGWLLGLGGLMPRQLEDRMLCELPLVLYTADHAEYSTTLQFVTHRLPSRHSLKRTERIRKRVPLFHGEDPQFEALESVFAREGQQDAKRSG